MRRVGVLLLTMAMVVSCANAWEDPEPEPKVVKTDSGLKYQDLKDGKGEGVKKGDTVQVHYTGWLAKTKKKFDSSHTRMEVYEFTLGAGRVIKGWDEGVIGMKVGGRRKLMIPAKLGYGAEGYDGLVPKNAELVFEMELVKIVK